MATGADVLAAAVTALEAMSGWTRSRLHPDLWPLTDGQGLNAHQWAVSVDGSDVLDGWRPTVPGMPGEKSARVRTTLRVRWCASYRPDAPYTDYATALGEVDDVLTAISAAVVTGIGQLTPAAISHQIAGDRWVVTTAVLHCVHSLTVRT